MSSPPRGAAFLAIVMMVGGGLGFRFAYTLSRFEERLDAIGSTTPGRKSNRPTGSLLNRIIFGGLAVVGAIWLLALLL